MLIELTFPCLQHSTDQSMHLQTAPLPFCMLNNCLGEPLQWCSPICYQLNFSLFLFIEIADFLLVCLKGHKWSCFSSFLSLASAWTIFWLLVIVSWLSCVAKSDSCFLCVTCFSDFPRQCSTHRSSHRKCSMIKDNLENFTKLTGKHLFQSLFLIWHRCFPVRFAKFSRTSFLQNTSGRLLLYPCSIWHHIWWGIICLWQKILIYFINAFINFCNSIIIE